MSKVTNDLKPHFDVQGLSAVPSETVNDGMGSARVRPDFLPKVTQAEPKMVLSSKALLQHENCNDFKGFKSAQLGFRHQTRSTIAL